jgi:hypothetical protein
MQKRLAEFIRPPGQHRIGAAAEQQIAGAGNSFDRRQVAVTLGPRRPSSMAMSAAGVLRTV